MKTAQILLVTEDIFRDAMPFLDDSLIEFLQSLLLTPDDSTTFEASLLDLLADFPSEISSTEAEQVAQKVLGELETEGIKVTKADASGTESDESECEDVYGGCVMCHRELPLTRHHVIPRTVHSDSKFKKLFTKEEMNTVIMLCRPCHSAIHKFIDEKTMALKFNTLEKLLAHEKVQKWVPYISKQKVRLRARQLS